MTHKGYTIIAVVPEYSQYSINEDGTLADFLDSGGLDETGTQYDIFKTDDASEHDADGVMVDCGYYSVDAAKVAIDGLLEKESK